MADQVFEIEPDNFKAHLRKAESLVVIEELAKAEKEIEICKELASDWAEKLEVEGVLERYREKEKKEKAFAKAAVSKGVYEDKPVVTPVAPVAPVDPNID